jgi:hypothetical protein
LVTSLGGSNGISYYVGEGAGPTWKTESTYTVSNIGTHQGGAASDEYLTADTDLIGSYRFGSGTTLPGSTKLYIDNVASSSVAKVATWQVSIPGQQWYVSGTGFWNADTNPITGLELVPGAGTISGTCSLYGLN